MERRDERLGALPRNHVLHVMGSEICCLPLSASDFTACTHPAPAPPSRLVRLPLTKWVGYVVQELIMLSGMFTGLQERG